ncbi:anthranilate 1,2-dioxygenase electron transfer component AntC [Marinomonas algicola]|uniref:anthranilate 1,2-dioxygenase electron transfer component AntC n=1 Tax=Marinomonas algicola TaxID=2773454 RepID=UPI00174A3571|nr:anthranilate 1,2-dioxygenase electron transfer component AntC [Marinomonas algicola]
MNHRVALNFSDGNSVFFEAKHNELLLDAAFRNGVALPVDCREGVCSTCKGLCESGKYEQDYIDEDALSEEEIENRYILSCQTRVQSPASFYYDIDSGLYSNLKLTRFEARVSNIENVSDSSVNLHLTLSDQSVKLDYLAGQYAKIHIPDTDQKRSYSFATSSNNNGELQFLIRVLPQGIMSDYVKNRCQVGDTLTLDAPLGSFYLREVQHRLIMVAGGTGLSAFLSMLDELITATRFNPELKNVPVELFYCVSREADLCELSRLDAYKTLLPKFSYQLIISNPSRTFTGHKGRITDVLNAQDLQSSTFDIYVCGPPPMIEAVKTWLTEEGVNNGTLYFEKFVAST